jgi:hypothetical protein
VIWALILPALIEEVVKLIPSLKLEYCFELELNDLKVLRYDIRLSGAAKLIDTFGGSSSKLLTMLTGLQVVLQLYTLASDESSKPYELTQLSILSSARANVV